MTSFNLLNMVKETLEVFVGGHIWLFMLIIIGIILLMLAMFRVPKVVFLMLFIELNERKDYGDNRRTGRKSFQWRQAG